MTTPIEMDEPRTERVAVEVELRVTHMVRVKIDGNTGQSIEDLKAQALAEYHRDPDDRARRVRDEWPNRFLNRANISVSSEQAEVESVKTRPTSVGRAW